jgi:DNA-binding transcriptional LysR family regulator
MSRNRLSQLQARHLEALIAVSAAGSVHGAARRLGLPQPALSRLVVAAESALGLKIFERSYSGAQLTDPGRRVLRQAAYALRALQSVSEATRHPVPLLRVGCIPRVMHTLVPHLLAQVNSGKSPYSTQIFVGTSQELTADLNAARLDFVIGRQSLWPSSVQLEADDLTIESERLYEEETVIACGPANPLVPATVRSPVELAGLQWVLPKRGYYSRDTFDRLMADRGLRPIEPVIEANNFELGLSMVASTSFVTLAPEFAARRFERLALVRIVPTRRSLDSSPVMLKFHKEQRSHPAFRAFRTAVLKAAQSARVVARTSGK